MIISLRILLSMRSVLDGSCTENHSAYFILSDFCRNRVVNGIFWENVVEPDRQQMTTYNTAHALCVLNNEGYRHALRICNTGRFTMYSGITKNYYRKAVGHVFTKPVQIEGTTRKFTETGWLCKQKSSGRPLTAEDDVERVRASVLHSPNILTGTAAK